MKPIIVANWKANKNIVETLDWVNQVKPQIGSLENVEVIVCPPFTSITALADALKDSTIKVGAQTVSDNTNGAFTGEVSASMLNGLVSHCIVGHSERQRYYGEKTEQIGEKVKLLLAKNITPILCISDINQMDNYLQTSPDISANAERIIFVYEPPSAISGGGDYHPQTPQEASANALKISEKLGKKVVTLYGGSVSEMDIKSFLEAEGIAGVLIGKASLDPKTFVQLAQIASQTVV